MSAYPHALHFVPEGEEVAGVFASPAGKAVYGDVFFPGLGFCFFSIEPDCVSFFDRDCTFGTDAEAETHTVAELLGYNLCFSVNDFNSTLIP